MTAVATGIYPLQLRSAAMVTLTVTSNVTHRKKPYSSTGNGKWVNRLFWVGQPAFKNPACTRFFWCKKCISLRPLCGQLWNYSEGKKHDLSVAELNLYREIKHCVKLSSNLSFFFPPFFTHQPEYERDKASVCVCVCVCAPTWQQLTQPGFIYKPNQGGHIGWLDSQAECKLMPFGHNSAIHW